MYLHPSVKHIVQEQIGKNRTYDRTLGYSHLAFRLISVLILIRNSQPSLNVQEHPSFPDMDANRLHQQFMVYGIKEFAYIHIQYPGILEASLTRLGYGIMCGFVGTVSIRVLMKDWGKSGHDGEYHCHLGDSVR